MKFSNGVTTYTTSLNVAHTRFCNYCLIKKHSKAYSTCFLEALTWLFYKYISYKRACIFQHRSVNYSGSNSFSLFFFFLFRFTLNATHQIKFSCIQNETKTGKFEVIPLVALRIKVWAAFFQNIFLKNAMMGLVMSMFTVQGSRCHFD